MKVVGEYSVGDGFVLGCHLGEGVHVGVVLSRDVVELQAAELSLQLADLLAVRVHEGALAVGVLCNLVDYQL